LTNHTLPSLHEDEKRMRRKDTRPKTLLENAARRPGCTGTVNMEGRPESQNQKGEDRKITIQRRPFRSIHDEKKG